MTANIAHAPADSVLPLKVSSPQTPELSLAQLDRLVPLLTEIHGPARTIDYLLAHVRDLRRLVPTEANDG